MRSSTKSWLISGAVALSATALAACSADGGGDLGGDDSGAAAQDAVGTDTSTGHDAGTAQDSSLAQDSGNDTSVAADTSATDVVMIDVVSDTGHVDAAGDAGVVDASEGGAAVDAGDGGLAAVGSPCAALNATQKQVCGTCGFQERVCSDPGDAGHSTWQPWGFCQAEVANGCTPGSQTSEACGLCGTRVKQCQNDCAYAVGACTGQPPNACSPGSVDFEVGLSCDAGGRQRTCQSSCTWDNFGACFIPDGGALGNNFLVVPSTAGAKATKTFSMPSSTKLKRLSTGSCPLTSLSTTLTSYTYVQLQNNNGQAATVSIFHAQSQGATYIDSVMAVYATVSPPADTNDVAREQCKTGTTVNDTCSDTTTDPLACASSWAGLMIGDSHQVTIPAHSYVWVYSAAYFAADSGNFDLNVITNSLQ